MHLSRWIVEIIIRDIYGRGNKRELEIGEIKIEIIERFMEIERFR